MPFEFRPVFVVKKCEENGSEKGGVHRCPCCSCFPGQEMVEIQVEKNAVTVNSAISTFGCRSSAGGGLSFFFWHEWEVCIP